MRLLAAIAVGLVAMPSSAQTPPPEAQRISFQIATGPVSGSYLRVGEAIAHIISFPPGLVRCEVAGVCGPEGLIALSRSSGGSVANALSTQSGRVKSAIVQADIAAAAYHGTGPFKSDGPQKNLRALARLHDEVLHLVVGSKVRVKRLRDLYGKRVGIGTENSAVDHTVRSVLQAAKMSARRVRFSHGSAEEAAEDLRTGKLDAFFVIGVAPIDIVDGLVRRGQARVVGIDSSVLAALTKKNQMLGKSELAADTYRGSKAVSTLSIATIWLANESLPADVAYAILRSLWNPANRSELERLGPVATTINVKKAGESLPIPLHKGARRFYAEVGR
jgi:uncharacterized protein